MVTRRRTTKPVIPFIQLYDLGTQTFTVAGEFHTWDTVNFKTSDFRYASDDDKIAIYVPSTGFYEVTFECNFTKSGAGFATATTQLFLNGSGVSGAKSINCAYDTGQGDASCAFLSLHFVIYLNANDYVQIKTTASADSLVSSAETSRLIIKFIPAKGWNNNAGGQISYKGNVMR